MNRREAEEIALALVLLWAAGFGVLLADNLGVVEGFVPDLSWLVSASNPLLIGLAVVFSALVTVLLASLAIRYGVGPGEQVAGGVGRLVGAVVPSTPLGRAAVGLTLGIVLMVAVIGGLPNLVGDLGEADNSPVNFADELGDQALNADWDDVTQGDAVGGAVCPVDDASGPPAGEPDADGDGLPDAWERRGETPDGVSLDGADPERKDLYVQVNYGESVDRLSDAERDQLRTAWAEMPVDNPDGSQGIDLHLVDEGGQAGSLGEQAVFEDSSDATRYYTRERMGDRACVYHQVTFGQFDMGRTKGVGQSPGYAAIVDGTQQPEYEGSVSFRVGVTVHELLHNVAGPVDGRDHTDEGWLQGGPDNEFLSEATASELNEDGLRGAD